MTNMIDVSNLTFDYASTRALTDISFSIAKNSVTALVGPNGAGKTTLLRCIAGLEKPLSGNIKVAGIDVFDDPRAAHLKMGYLSDFFGLYDALTVRQCLTYMAWAHKIAPDKIAGRIDDIAARTLITDKMEAKAGTLSRGYRQRLGLALALIHDPDVLLLDEPASGMDPEARITLSRLMLKLKAAGKTILVSSHILNELEDYCSAMLVIRKGVVSEHVRLTDTSVHALHHVVIGVSGAIEAALTAVQSRAGIQAASIKDRMIHCKFSGGAAEQAALLASLVNAGLTVNHFSVADEKLSDAYMNIAMNEKKS